MQLRITKAVEGWSEAWAPGKIVEAHPDVAAGLIAAGLGSEDLEAPAAPAAPEAEHATE